MGRNVFGNLEEWGRVLEQLGELARTGSLDEHQEALAELLRYPDNWRLREAALETVPLLSHPSDALVREISAILLDEGLYHQVRVLAAEALAAALDRRADHPRENRGGLRRTVREQLNTLLSCPAAPLLHQAARRVLPRVQSSCELR